MLMIEIYKMALPLIPAMFLIGFAWAKYRERQGEAISFSFIFEVWSVTFFGGLILFAVTYG